MHFAQHNHLKKERICLGVKINTEVSPVFLGYEPHEEQSPLKLIVPETSHGLTSE